MCSSAPGDRPHLCLYCDELEEASSYGPKQSEARGRGNPFGAPSWTGRRLRTGRTQLDPGNEGAEQSLRRQKPTDVV